MQKPLCPLLVNGKWINPFLTLCSFPFLIPKIMICLFTQYYRKLSEIPFGRSEKIGDLLSMPYKRGCANKQGSEKIPKFINGGIKINGRLECKKWPKVIIKQRKHQKQVAIKRETKIYTEARYFALNIGCE